MKKQNLRQIDWKKCNSYLKELVPQIDMALDSSKYQRLREVTRRVAPVLGKIRLSLSRKLKNEEEIDEVVGLVGMLADELRLKVEPESNNQIHLSGSEVQDPIYSGIRSYLFEPKDYTPFLKQQTA